MVQKLGQIQDLIRNVPDFPKAGIIFKDITPIFESPEAFSSLVDRMCISVEGVTKIVAVESRGFILGAAMAQRKGLGLVLARKAGKLPGKTVRQSYLLEYGEDHLEMRADALCRSDRVMIVDDVLATGGTAEAVWKMCQTLEAEVVGLNVFIELSFLEGRKRLHPLRIASLIQDAGS